MSQNLRQENLVRKFLLLYGILSAVLIIVFGLVFFVNFNRRAFNNISAHAQETAEALADNIDFSGHDALRTPADMQSPIYERIYSDLRLATKTCPEVTYIYTMRPQKGTTWEFVLDATLEKDSNQNGLIDDDEAQAVIGELYDTADFPEMREALIDPTADHHITSDAWGDWISGYAPIHNAAGATIGVVGVDISAENYFDERNTILKLIGLTMLIVLVASLIFLSIGVTLVERESKKIQETLKIRNSDLETEVRKRTLSLKKFILVVVHELRAPLTSIKWGLELIAQNRHPRKETEQLKQIEGILNNLLNLISKLLDANRVGIQKLPIEKRIDNFSEVVQNSINEFQPQAEFKNLNLKIEMPAKIPAFAFDSKRLMQVLNNLLSNAIKYTKKGSIKVEVSINKQKRRLHVAVHDTGLGISQADQKEIFQPFVRVGKNNETGSGLGLVITKGIVEAHGGSIGVTSERGQGSTFWFELPMKNR